MDFHISSRQPALPIVVCTLSLLAALPALCDGQPCRAPDFVTSGATKRASTAAYEKLGNWYEQAGRPECAMEAYRHEILLAPNSASPHVSLARALHASGRIGDSATELRRALELDPASSVAHLSLGVLEHDRGNLREALAQWDEVLDIDPKSIRAIDWIAKTRIETQQHTAAIDLLSTAPDNEDLVMDCVIAYVQSAFYEQAIAKGENSIAQHPDWLRLRMALATVYVQRNRYQEAMALLNKGLQTHPHEVTLQTLYLQILALTGDIAQGKAYAEKFLKEHPRNFDGLYLNGLLDRQDGDYNVALTSLKAAELLNPDHFGVHFNLGATFAKLHRFAEAKAELEKASAKDPSGADVHFQLAGVLRSLNDGAGAKQQMDLYQTKLRERALRDQTVSLAAQAAQRLASGDAVGAAEAEMEILKILPDDAVHYYNLSLAQDRMENFQAERASLERAVALRPDFALAYNQLGYLAIRRDDMGEAESCFRKAIESAPQYAEAQSNMGSLLAKQGKDTEAEQYFRMAVAANPRYTEAWINLAASLAARSLFSEAKKAALHALLIEPDNADAKQLLALLLSSNAGREQ